MALCKYFRIVYAIIFVSIITFFGCTHDTSSITDKAEWRHLSEANPTYSFFSFYNNHVYNGWVYPSTPSYITTYLDTIPYVDIPTFQVCQNRRYAKDKNRVYYPIIIECWDGEVCGGNTAIKYIIHGADPKSFKYLGDEYAVDKYNMYYRGEVIPWDENKIKELQANH